MHPIDPFPSYSQHLISANFVFCAVDNLIPRILVPCISSEVDRVTSERTGMKEADEDCHKLGEAPNKAYEVRPEIGVVLDKANKLQVKIVNVCGSNSRSEINPITNNVNWRSNKANSPKTTIYIVQKFTSGLSDFEITAQTTPIVEIRGKKQSSYSVSENVLLARKSRPTILYFH